VSGIARSRVSVVLACSYILCRIWRPKISQCRHALPQCDLEGRSYSSLPDAIKFDQPGLRRAIFRHEVRVNSRVVRRTGCCKRDHAGHNIIVKINCTPPPSAITAVMPFVASFLKTSPTLVTIATWGKLRIVELRRG
jgi:hypothetical protein